MLNKLFIAHIGQGNICMFVFVAVLRYMSGSKDTKEIPNTTNYINAKTNQLQEGQCCLWVSPMIQLRPLMMV